MQPASVEVNPSPTNTEFQSVYFVDLWCQNIRKWDHRRRRNFEKEYVTIFSVLQRVINHYM